MILKSDNFYLFLFFTSVFSSLIFCIGFFPFSNQKEAKFDNRKIDELNTKIADRNILMIVDALRLDMVEKDDMPNLHQLLESGEACSMKLKVDLPTVTKPRITALISGKNLLGMN
jgi:predicted AlkP superfamily pyrophosphatase or phosphodiesterase